MPLDPSPTRPIAYRGMGPFVFVSYSHEDENAIYPELERLTAEGFALYYDDAVTAGHPWHDELANAIERCAAFVLFLTPRSAVSQHCQRELHFALDLDKPIIVVHLQPVELPSGLRLALGDKQAILAHAMPRDRYERRVAETLEVYVPRIEPADLLKAPPTVERGRVWRLAAVGGPIAAAILLGYAAWQWSAAEDAAGERLATARELVLQDRYGEAFLVLRSVEHRLAGNPDFAALWQEITVPIEPQVADDGVTVRFRPYETPNADWIDVGVSPVQDVPAPLGTLLLQLEKPGFVTREFAVGNPGPLLGNVPADQQWRIGPVPKLELTASGVLPEDMVAVPATDVPIFLKGFSRRVNGDARLAIPAFAVGRFEVTNREYKDFVDAGGYARAKLWQGLMLPDGTPLGAESVARFVDATERPGPATWALGTYPTGTAELPVGGISWYEAVAYARFRDQALPTLHHWARAAFAPYEAFHSTAPAISRASVFDAESPAPADQPTGIGPWGTVNTAGNVREWVWTWIDDQGLAMGGAWSDYPSLYQHTYTLDPMSRSPQNGLRLMSTLGTPIDPALLDPVSAPVDTAFSRRNPVTDEAFAAMRFQFTHVYRTPDAIQLEVVDENDTWSSEEVVLTFAAGETRTLYVVKPVGAETRALQPVIYMPHGGATTRMPNRNMLTHVPPLDFIVRAGRALVIPIWAGTAQRAEPTASDPAANADRMRKQALAFYEDVAGTIDYLETRKDIDTQHIGFLGISFGAINGPIPLAIERRFSAAVLIAGGIRLHTEVHPMLDSINYLPRVDIPVLMINGRYDHLFLYESSQRRMFDLLGTPIERRRQVLYDTGHFDFPRNQVAREASDWFDRYLGPS
jgi:formylglycine-generating enzyme required for sulfatase activity